MNVIQRMSLCVLAAAAAFVSAPHGARAQDSGLRVTVTSVSDDTYPHARAIIGIENTDDAASAALNASNFTVTLDGEPATVVSADLAAAEDAPLDLLIIVDVSGSMAGAPLANAKTAAKLLIAELGAQDRIALLRFGDEVVLAQDYTADRAAIDRAIDTLVAQGNTALYQATAAGAVSIGGAGASRRAVVLLSDGADFGGRSAATREEALAAAENVGVPFFTIAQGTDLDLPYLQQLADRTSGRLLQAPRPEDLDALYVSIGRLLRSQYVVTFDASAAASTGSNVVFTVTDGDQQSSAEQNYTPGADFLPTVSIEGLAAGETLLAPREITAIVSSGSPRVRWYVDDVNVFEVTVAPYIFRYDPAVFGEGPHTLRVAVGDGPAATESSVAFRSTPPAAAASGGPPVIPIAGVAGAIILAGAAFLLVKRRAPKGDRPIPADQRTRSWAEQIAQTRSTDGAELPTVEIEAAQEDIGKAMGMLISRAGTDLGTEYTIGGKPVSIGAAVRCGVRINDPDLASEEARIWVRGEHLMLHVFTRLTTIEAGGSSGSWQILEPGDTFQIAQHTFEFRLLPSVQAAPADDAIPNVLRDAEPPGDAPPRPTLFGEMMPRAD